MRYRWKPSFQSQINVTGFSLLKKRLLFKSIKELKVHRFNNEFTLIRVSFSSRFIANAQIFAQYFLFKLFRNAQKMQ